MADENFQEPAAIEAQLSESLDNLQEQRASTRERALEFLIKEFRKNYLEDFSEHNQVTLLENLKKSVKRGAGREQFLAPTLLSLVAITLGADSETFFKEISPIYSELISKGLTNDQNFASIIDGLGVLCFVSNQDNQATIQSMELMKKVFSSKSSPLATAAALHNWGFLLTTVPIEEAFSIIQDTLLRVVLALQSDSVEVRMAAGEDIALMFEISKKARENFGLKNFSTILDVENMIDTIHDLSNDRSKGRKEKNKQKNIFRQVAAYLEREQMPLEQLSFKFQKFQFDSWSSIVQLESFRECLGEGFHVHFIENRLLQEIFHIKIDKDAKKAELTHSEKRLFLSPSSASAKKQSQRRSQQRASKNFMNSFINDNS